MEGTLTFGGDTDTNCCIVGGMIGAKVGLKGLPEDKMEKIMGCDIKEGKQNKRPKWLQVRECDI